MTFLHVLYIVLTIRKTDASPQKNKVQRGKKKKKEKEQQQQIPYLLLALKLRKVWRRQAGRLAI